MHVVRVCALVLVAAVLVALGAVALTAAGAPTARKSSIPPATLWAINETAQVYGIRTITLPPGTVFSSWHRQTSAVPFHRGLDTVVEFTRGGRLAATWTATRLYPHGVAGCGALYGSHPMTARVGGHTIYATPRRGGEIAWMCLTDTPYFPMVYQLWSDRLPRTQVISIVGASRYRYQYTVSPYVDFWTPSRNIGCLAYVPGQGLDPGVLTCYIRSGLRPAPARRSPGCRNGAFGWGAIVQLILPQSGGVGTASDACWPYEPVDTSARILEYGHSINAFGATCRSTVAGLRCSNQENHGFFLSREHSYLF